MNRKQLRNGYNLKIHIHYTNLLGKAFLEITILFIELMNWQFDLNDLRGISKYNNGYNYILTVIDIFSKMLFTRVLKHETPSEVTDAFKSIFKESQSEPKNLQSDKGTEFTGQKVKKHLCKELTQPTAKRGYLPRTKEINKWGPEPPPPPPPPENLKL